MFVGDIGRFHDIFLATKPDIFETMSVFVATEAAFESLSCGSLS